MNTLSVPPLILAAVTFYVGAYHALIYPRQRERRDNLTFALSCLAMGLYDLFAAGLYNVTSAADGVHWQRAQVATLALVAIAFTWFVYDYLKSVAVAPSSAKTVLTCLSIYFALAAVTGMLDHSGLYRPLDQPDVKQVQFFGRQISYYEMDPGPLSELQSVAGLAAFVYLLLIAVRAYRHGFRKETRPLLLAMALFFISAVNDTAVSLGLYPFVYTMEYAYLGMVLLMTYSLTSTVVEAAVMKQALQRSESSLRESEARYRQSVENSPNPIFTVDRQGTIQMWNQACEQVFRYKAEEILGQAYHRLLWNPQDHAALDILLTQVWQGLSAPGLSTNEQEMQCRCKDGTQRIMVTRIYPVCDLEGQVEGCVFANADITNRKRAERLLQALNVASLAMQRAVTPQEVLTTAGEEFKKLGFACTIFLANEDQSRLFPKYVSYDRKAVRLAERLMGVKTESFSLPVEASGVLQQATWEGKTLFLNGSEDHGQVLPGPLRRLAGPILKILEIPKSVVAPLILEDKTVGLLTVQSDDLTEDDMPAITAFAHQMSAAWRKARLMHDLETSLEELKHTQAQLLQAQKMEAIGRLAGGVAHDFNNMLTVVHLSTRLLKRQLHPEDPLREHVQQIEEAGERASALTKHLLSFSRRGIIKPHVVDLNHQIGSLSQMLQRIIGDDIELVTELADELWPVYLDPTQIDQAIVNLAVNARDAMPNGGHVTIETANIVLDGASVARDVDVRPGEYVRLTVTDTGEGMGDEVKAHLFEPFFTTKERDHGTGLGLSTVFGIVKQNAGHIWVDSEVGQGTSVQIYLPRTEKVEPQGPPRVTSDSALRGSETILVVDDYAGVRDLATQILRAHGYQVLAAKDGAEALRISLEHDHPIHLLLTDMVMPGMNGKDLAEQLQSQRPGIRILYMSGYDDRLFEDPTALGESVAFLAKPLAVETLTEKVRALLDLPRSG